MPVPRDADKRRQRSEQERQKEHDVDGQIDPQRPMRPFDRLHSSQTEDSGYRCHQAQLPPCRSGARAAVTEASYHYTSLQLRVHTQRILEHRDKNSCLTLSGVFESVPLTHLGPFDAPR